MQHLAEPQSLNSSHDRNLNLEVGGLVFRVGNDGALGCVWMCVCVCAVGCASVNTDWGLEFWATTYVYSLILLLKWDLMFPGDWGREKGDLTSLTLILWGFHPHHGWIKGNRLRCTFQLLLLAHSFTLHLMPVSSSLSSLFLPPYLVPPLFRRQFEAKDAWLRAMKAQSALICCFALWAVKHVDKNGKEGLE